MIFLVICASCVSCCCCFALDFFSSLHSFFIVVSFWIFRTFFSSFVWGLPVLLCCRCVCVFFQISSCVCTQYKSSTQQKPHTIYILDVFFCSSFTLALVSYFLSVIIITTFLFVASVCNTHKTVCVYIFFSAHFEEFWSTITKKKKKNTRKV